MSGLNLAKRDQKPREIGLTCVTDLGVSFKILESTLQDYSDYVDIAKFGVGTAFLTKNLQSKVELYKAYNVIPYFGGTLFEKFYYQNKLGQYIDFLYEHDIQYIEVSNGITGIPLADRVNIIENIKDSFTIVAEVGSKDPHSNMSSENWVQEIIALQDAGASYVILEGRDAANAGMYSGNGKVKEELLDSILQCIDTDKLIFEAPTTMSQMYFINKIGSNVNLGNIPINNLLLLETQRAGLKNETFFINEESGVNHIK